MRVQSLRQQLVESFPEECRFVVESLREVYRTDALAKEQKLSDAARLALHQEQSRPVMDALHRWMATLERRSRPTPRDLCQG